MTERTYTGKSLPKSPILPGQPLRSSQPFKKLSSDLLSIARKPTQTEWIHTGKIQDNIPLSALDCFEAQFGLNFHYLFDYHPDPQQLKSSLRSTLEVYTLFNSRIKTSLWAPNGREFCQADPGVPFSICYSKQPAPAEWLQSIPKNSLKRVMPTPQPLLDFNNQLPSLRIKLTYFPGNLALISLGFLHAVCDGNGFFSFLNDWARAYRGEPISPIVQSRDKILAAESKIKAPSKVRGFRHPGKLAWSWEVVQILTKSLQNVALALPLTGSDIQSITHQAGTSVSKHTALSAWLWKFYLQQHPKIPKETELFSVADSRRWLTTRENRRYFGNAAIHTTVNLSGNEVCKMELSELAQMIGAEQKQHRIQEMHQQYAWIKEKVRRKQSYRIFASTRFLHSDIFISNLFKIPVYSVDFGGGKPLWGSLPAMPVPGIIQIFPHPEDKGGMVVHFATHRKNRNRLIQKWAEHFSFDPASHLMDQPPLPASI